MIRSCRQEPSLFYTHEELSRAPRKTFYDRLSSLDLDWRALSSTVAKAFCPLKNGRPTDPVLYFKAFLVGYLEGIEDDTALADRLADSISIRRFLFGSLLGTPPDHSSLSRVRAAVGELNLDGLLSACVDVMATAGLVGSDAMSVDTALVPSRARRSPVEGEDAPVYDPDVRSATKPGYEAQPSYKVAASVDSAHRVVVACDSYLANTGEGAAARLSVAEAAQCLKEFPQHVVADAGMDDAGFHTLVEFFGSTPVTALQTKNGKPASGLGKEWFRYEPEPDQYRCLAGKTLLRVSGPDALKVVYRADPTVCAACPMADICRGERKTTKDVSRHWNEASRDRVKERRKTPKARALLAQRRVIVEPVFADFKEWGGLAKIWTKGLGKARVKAKMAAIGWNLKILVKAVERGKAVLPKSPPPTLQSANLPPESAQNRVGYAVLTDFWTVQPNSRPSTKIPTAKFRPATFFAAGLGVSR